MRKNFLIPVKDSREFSNQIFYSGDSKSTYLDLTEEYIPLTCESFEDFTEDFSEVVLPHTEAKFYFGSYLDEDMLVKARTRNPKGLTREFIINVVLDTYQELNAGYKESLGEYGFTTILWVVKDGELYINPIIEH